MSSIKKEYQHMKEIQGSLVYLNPLFNPREMDQKAYVRISETISFIVVQIFDSPATETVEPIFTYQANKGDR